MTGAGWTEIRGKLSTEIDEGLMESGCEKKVERDKISRSGELFLAAVVLSLLRLFFPGAFQQHLGSLLS